MGQTIICEYLTTWAETGIAPDPTAFGFDGLYSMLEKCQDTMLELGTAANDGKRHMDQVVADLKSQLEAKDEAIANLRGSLASTRLHTIAWEARKRVAELEEKVADQAAQIATLKLDNAAIAGVALDATNIFPYTEPLQ